MIEPAHAPFAANSLQSQGRQYAEAYVDFRNPYQRDRDRIVHSTAFRRLEYKTQVFINHEGDHFRTRLTHSLEVAQLARTAARELRLHEDLTEAICLAHDLGHTPFGHAGQDALNHCMRDYGGFEHNLQSLRVVDELEQRYADFPGLNLTFETREGILKHCNLQHAEVLGELGQRFLSGKHPGLEAQLSNMADEIAYYNHDMDDGLRAGLLNIEQLRGLDAFAEPHEAVCRAYPGLRDRPLIHETIRRIINTMMTDMIHTSGMLLLKHQPQSVTQVRDCPEALICFSPPQQNRNKALKEFLYHSLYCHPKVLRDMRKGQEVIKQLFHACMEDVRLLPLQIQQQIQSHGVENTDIRLQHQARTIADYIAGMTDRFAITEHGRLFDIHVLG